MICVHWAPPDIVMKTSGFFEAMVVMGSTTVGALTSTFSVVKSILSLLGDCAEHGPEGGVVGGAELAVRHEPRHRDLAVTGGQLVEVLVDVRPPDHGLGAVGEERPGRPRMVHRITPGRGPADQGRLRHAPGVDLVVDLQARRRPRRPDREDLLGVEQFVDDRDRAGGVVPVVLVGEGDRAVLAGRVLERALRRLVLEPCFGAPDPVAGVGRRPGQCRGPTDLDLRVGQALGVAPTRRGTSTGRP